MNYEHMTLTEIEAERNRLISECLTYQEHRDRLKAQIRKFEDYSYSQKLYDPSHWPSQADV